MRVVEERGWKERPAEIGNSRLSGSRLIANAPVRGTATGGKAIIEAKQLASEAATCRDRSGADKPDSVTGWIGFSGSAELMRFQRVGGYRAPIFLSLCSHFLCFIVVLGIGQEVCRIVLRVHASYDSAPVR